MSWERWKPTADEPWNLQRVVHLHRRSGFGASWAELKRDLDDGPDAAIDRVLQSVTSDEAARFDQPTESIGHAAVGSHRPEQLQAWWLLRLLKSPFPLREKLALMWHNHFATSNAKVGSLSAMKEQNETFYKLAAGSFSDLFTSLAKDPALLYWLDAPSNRKGRPNENLAREIMELFTLGVGNYTEQDVREAARALTGWSVNRQGNFEYVAASHDDGPKTILGKTGRFDGDDLLKILLQQPAVADRIAWRVCDTFMGEGVVNKNAFDSLASVLTKTDLDIGKTIEIVLRSKSFFADANLGSRIASPVEFVLAPLRALEMDGPPPSTLKLAKWTSELGQPLFYPPNVGGWRGGRSWLSTRHVVARANFAASLADGKLRSRYQPAKQGEAETFRLPAGVDSLQHFNQLLFGGRLSLVSQRRIHAAMAEAKLESDQLTSHTLALMLALPEAQQS